MTISSDYAEDFKKIVRIKKDITYGGSFSYTVYILNNRGEMVKYVDSLKTYDRAFNIALKIYKDSIKKSIDVTFGDRTI